MALRAALALAALGLGLGVAGCGSGETAAEGASPARSERSPDTGRAFMEGLRRARRQPEHASDAGGRVTWRDGPVQAISGVPRRYRLVYEVGPHGIARGGAVWFQVSPYWGWTKPQLRDPRAPGHTTVEASAPDADLEVRALEPKTVRVRVTGRALTPGETLVFDYGAGPAGAVARFAEERARFRFAVDGDGDGAYDYVPEERLAHFPVRAAPAAALVVTVPGTARVGQTVHVNVAAVDRNRNAARLAGELRFHALPAGFEAPERFDIGPDDEGHARIPAIVRAPGVVRLRVDGPDGLRGWSNPLVVGDGPRVLWGDVHGHTALSDGTGSPDEYFRYARDVAGLDVAALTDHDAWGAVPLDRAPGSWETIQRVTQRFHEPDRFVTILGYEWTHWEHGHRHVLYFEDRGPVLSALDPAYESPPKLWDALRGRRALTFAHHSAGGPVSTNWDFAPDPVLEPVTEISSVHGSSEAPDAPRPVDPTVAGNFVRDALDRGYDLGFIGSGDSHDGHPGAVPQRRPPGGLAAFLAEDLTRDAVFEALRARRVYATNGPRIVLRATLGGHAMGASIPVPRGETLDEALVIRVVAPRNLARVDVVRSGRIVASIPAEARSADLELRRDLADLSAGEYVYVRAVQEDGGAAWSSPFFLEASDG